MLVGDVVELAEAVADGLVDGDELDEGEEVALLDELLSSSSSSSELADELLDADGDAEADGVYTISSSLWNV